MGPPPRGWSFLGTIGSFEWSTGKGGNSLADRPAGFNKYLSGGAHLPIPPGPLIPTVCWEPPSTTFLFIIIYKMNKLFSDILQPEVVLFALVAAALASLWRRRRASRRVLLAL